MLGLMQDWPLRLHRIIDHAAIQHGTREVVSREADGSLARTTYAELRSAALRIAARLVAAGIGPGDRVATLAWNSGAHLETWYGIAGIGAVYHTVNPRLFPDQIAWIIAHAADRMLFVDSCFLPLVARLADHLTELEQVVVLGGVDDAGLAAHPRAIRFDDWMAEAATTVGWAEVEETAAAGLCYTSGTTDAPKGVLYSHRSTTLHAMLIAGANAMAIAERDCVMPIVPMFHVNAWGLPFAAPMMGAKLVMPGARLDGASVYDLMEREGVTVAAGVPTVWMGLLDHMRRTGARFSTFKRLLVGGSACPRALIAAFEQEFDVEVCHAWGMTETSPVASVGSRKVQAAVPDEEARLDVKQKQGYAPFGVEMRIVDDAGAVLPWDGRSFGRLMVRGYAVLAGYFADDRPVLDADGYFDTGDVATIDALGTMQIVDRTKDVIKSGGEWISSIAIENLAVAHPGVAEAAVIGISHPTWGERPLLVLVGRAAGVPSRQEMLDFLAPSIARWWMPDDVQVVADLPHTATGKVSKRMLRAQFADYRLPVSAGPE